MSIAFETGNEKTCLTFQTLVPEVISLILKFDNQDSKEKKKKKDSQQQNGDATWRIRQVCIFNSGKIYMIHVPSHLILFNSNLEPENHILHKQSHSRL